MSVEARPMPKWLMTCYSQLWKKTKGREFDFDLVLRTLKYKDEGMISLALSRLNKHGWLTVKINPKDSRKRIYQLKNPEEGTLEIAKTS
jgi:DNA-binding transcriptional regulator PaaX